jgi:hypothetical protein
MGCKTMFETEQPANEPLQGWMDRLILAVLGITALAMLLLILFGAG